MTSTVPTGRFVWFDLMTTDQPGAIDFYTKVLGWTTEDWTGGGPNRYPMWKNAQGTTLGGSQQLPPEQQAQGVPSHWIGYVAVPNVDETAQEAASLVARTYVPPTDIPTVGRFAVLADPQGAVFAVFTPAGDAPGHDGRAEIGEVSWHELMTSDYQAGFAFYSTLFGWKKSQAFDMGEMGTYQLFARNGGDIGGMMNKPDPGMPSAWTYYVRVANLAEATKRVSDNGGSVMTGPTEVPGGDQIVVAMDPQGAVFALHEVRS
jgi:uncharacterized protein